MGCAPGSEVAPPESTPRIDRSSTEELLRLADLYFGHGRLAEARAVLEGALALDPTSGRAWPALLVVLDRAGDDGGVLEAIARWASVTPDRARIERETVRLGLSLDPEAGLRASLRLDPESARSESAAAPSRATGPRSAAGEGGAR